MYGLLNYLAILNVEIFLKITYMCFVFFVFQPKFPRLLNRKFVTSL